MKNIFYFLCAAAALASCSSSYNIQGTSDVQNLDGHMMYIKALEGSELKNIDSCDVLHGKPIVLEEGDITIKFNTAKQTCTGTFLNDKLNDFIEKYNQITSQIADLSHQEAQAMMNGEDMNLVYRDLQKKSISLNEESDNLITTFIEQNFDNVLGPFVFRMVTDTEIPMTNAWIEALMVKATEKFKNDRYVKEFMDEANRNQAIMTGMDDPSPAIPETPAEDKDQTAPTPNEMAKPQK